MKLKFTVFSLFYILVPAAIAVTCIFLNSTSEIDGILTASLPKVDFEIFVEVPEGKFTLSKTDYSVSSFYISKTEITVKDYFDITGKNPTNYDNDSDFPVVNVTWNDAANYCNFLSKSQKFDPVYEVDGNGKVSGYDLSKNGYRLPTKNEWYFAAIGADKKEEDKTNTVEYIDKSAWFYYNSDHEAHPVAQKQPNALGIYDMRGNVSEWCNDDAWDWADTDKLNITKDFCYSSGRENAQKSICGGFYDNSAKKLDFLTCQDLCVADGSNICYGFRIAKSK